ncbi:CPBP family intramembrane metalloprotease [Lachnospiraceae bacterium ZAX-1]
MEKKDSLYKQHKIPKQIWRAIYPPAIYFGMQILISIIVMIPYALSHTFEELLAFVDRSILSIAFLSALICIPLFVLFARLDLHRGDKNQFSKRKTVLVIPFALAVTWTLDVLLSLPIVTDLFPSYEQHINATFSGSLWIQILYIGITAPIAEELCFRKLIFRRLRVQHGFAFSAVIMAAIFGILHFNFLQSIYAFFFALLLAWLYEKSGSILASILFHATVNIVGIFVTKFLPNVEIADRTVWSVTFVTFVLSVVLFLVIGKGTIHKDEKERVDPNGTF